MTAQVADLVSYQEQQYTLISSTNEKIFNPQDFGLELKGLSTNCWRGWQAKYSIIDNVLYLEKLFVSGKISSFPIIHDAKPLILDGQFVEHGLGRAEYTFIKFKMAYSGELYAGKNEGKKCGIIDPMLIMEFDIKVMFQFTKGLCISVNEDIELVTTSATRSAERNYRLTEFLNEEGE